MCVAGNIEGSDGVGGPQLSSDALVKQGVEVCKVLLQDDTEAPFLEHILWNEVLGTLARRLASQRSRQNGPGWRPGRPPRARTALEIRAFNQRMIVSFRSCLQDRTGHGTEATIPPRAPGDSLQGLSHSSP